MPDAIDLFAERIRGAAAAGGRLRLRGGGSKDFYGQALQGDVLDTRGHAGIIAYEPTELVITARCGTPLAEVEAELARNGQMLPFEPPHFSAGATLGGMVATGLSGPRRASAGALRDFVLGVKLMDGRGEALTFGGQVMKNVAGYDVSRLMAGAMGCLGLMLEVSMKTLPVPPVELTLQFEMPEARAIEMFNQWAGHPLPVSATVWHDGEVRVRLSGAETAVLAAADRIGGERLEAAQSAAFWQGVREHDSAFFGGDAPLWRLSVPSNAPSMGLTGAQMIEWNGALRWVLTHADARTVREAASQAGGHATLFRDGDKSAGVFHPLPAALLGIHQRLKQVFDPHGVFNRGRMYADF